MEFMLAEKKWDKQNVTYNTMGLKVFLEDWLNLTSYKELFNGKIDNDKETEFQKMLKFLDIFSKIGKFTSIDQNEFVDDDMLR